jgi:anti-sigma28 factor (negative regulator of flagellin synthesis)
MGINEVTSSGLPIQPSQPKKVKEEQSSKSSSKDKVEVSEEARSLFESERAKKLEEIQKKIDEGFYSKREVIEQVADAMLNDIKKQVSE